MRALRSHTDEELAVLWESFADTPILADECIEEHFLHFPKGTDRLEIWHWFDVHHSKGLAFLQGVT